MKRAKDEGWEVFGLELDDRTQLCPYIAGSLGKADEILSRPGYESISSDLSDFSEQAELFVILPDPSLRPRPQSSGRYASATTGSQLSGP